GVSGEVANKMADLLARISSGLQLICISHLPQIASKGQQHFKVYKSVTENSTTTEIVLLNKDQRLLEIAEMLSGKDPSDAAVQNARELLN
ncbi:MAG: DNA repair protein RecN (Recombination protein N), partial [Parvicellaceae bacterium]